MFMSLAKILGELIWKEVSYGRSPLDCFTCIISQSGMGARLVAEDKRRLEISIKLPTEGVPNMVCVHIKRVR